METLKDDDVYCVSVSHQSHTCELCAETTKPIITANRDRERQTDRQTDGHRHRLMPHTPNTWGEGLTKPLTC